MCERMKTLGITNSARSEKMYNGTNNHVPHLRAHEVEEVQ